MSEDEDSKGGNNDFNDPRHDRPTQDTPTDGSSIRQTKAKTYTYSAQRWRFNGALNNREFSEDDEATLPKSQKQFHPLYSAIVNTSRPMRNTNHQVAFLLVTSKQPNQ